MTTWKDISDQLSLLLNDDAKASFSENLRKAAFNRALQYFAVTHTAPLRTVTASAYAYAEGAMVSFPSDYLELPSGGVEIPTTDESTRSAWLEPVGITPGMQVPASGYMLMQSGIYLTEIPVANVRLWYFGIYNKAVNDASDVDVPLWAEWAVVNLTCAYLLYPTMMSQASLRQFQTRREAGSPEDNPPRAQAIFFIRLYDQIVGKVKTQDRSTLYVPG